MKHIYPKIMREHGNVNLNLKEVRGVRLRKELAVLTATQPPKLFGFNLSLSNCIGGWVKARLSLRGRGARPASYATANFFPSYDVLVGKAVGSFHKGKNLGGWTAGFTLIELLIVIGIMITLTVVGVFSVGRYQGSQGIKNTLKEISSAINDTRKRSVAQEGGYAWGMRFVNTTSSQRYEIFRGASYALGTVQNTYPLSIRGMKFSNPFTSSTVDFAFSARTGALSAKQAVSVVTGAGDFFMGDVVANTLGNIVTRFENGIIGYWHFDEGTATTTYDASGQGNNGAATNSPTWQSGSNCKAGGCLSFSGASSQYVTIGDPAGGELDFGNSTDFSITSWFKRASGISGTEIIVSKRDGAAATNAGYEIGLRSTGNLYARIADGTTEILTANDGASEADGSWHFFAVTFDRDGNVSRYIDGSAYGATIAESSTNSINNSISFKIGSRTVGASETDSPITGSIDEVRIYNRALTAAEVLSIYNDLK